jgi:metal-responsive CopG/Arc/MetJ family transcriptional regulator
MTSDKESKVIIHNVPDELLFEFDNKVVKKHFPGGRGEAFRRLMADAIKDEENGRFA